MLEGEIWKATSVNGDLDTAKLLHLRSILEREVLKATLNALVHRKKDPERTKRDIQELNSIIRRDKRGVEALLSLIPLVSK